jgi:fibronectin-binding autotransporter adhesin
MIASPRTPRACAATSMALALAAFVCSADALASTCIWTGASNSLWSVAGNWSGCAGAAPVNGDSLQFPETGINKNTTHELAPLNQVTAISFTGTTSGYTLSGNGLTIGDGGISNSNTSGSNQIDMDLILGTAQFFAGSSAGMLLTNGLDLNGQTLKITWPVGSGTAAWSIAAVISGNGAIEATGLGNPTGLNLTGDNTFSGPVTFKSGRSRLFHSHALGIGDGSLANGTTVQADAGLVLDFNLSIGNEALTLTPGAGWGGFGQLGFVGATNWGGPVHLLGPGNSRVASSSSGASLQFNEVISGDGGLNLGSLPNVSIKLSNAGNSFAGSVNTIAESGFDGVSVKLGGNFAVPTTASVLLNHNSVFDLNGFNADIASLNCTTSDNLALSFGGSLTVGSNNADMNWSCQISGNGSFGNILTKVGSGVLTVSADNIYNGEVDVLGGGLQVNGGLIADPSSAVFVSSGQNAALFGVGVVGNVVSSGIVHGGGLILPGTLSTEAVNFVGIGKLSARLASPSSYDKLDVSALSLSPDSTLAVSLGFMPPPGSMFTLVNNRGVGAIVGTFNGLPQGASLIVGETTPLAISYIGGTGNDLTLTVQASLSPLLSNGFE